MTQQAGVNKKYYVLMGDVGSGKSRICEKITGRTGLSSSSPFSFTRDSKVFMEGDIFIADTPGLHSSKERLDHALNLLGALRYQPITSLLFICPCKDRIDGIIEYIEKTVSPFFDEFEKNIGVIVTKQDLQPQLSCNDIKSALIDLGIKFVFVSDKNTTKADYLQFLSSVNTLPVDVTIAPAQLTSYLNLADSNLSLRRKYDNYVKQYKEISQHGMKHLETLSGDERIDFSFSFKTFMKDLIVDFQQAFTEQVQGDISDVNFLLWTLELAKELKRELLQIRIQCRSYIQTSVNHDYRKCPYCGNVWALVEGCLGTTTCGAMPSSMDSKKKAINVLNWNWRDLYTKGFNFNSYTSSQRSVSGGRTAQSGKNPELPKPCGNNIAFKDMAPVIIPTEWSFESKETVADVADLAVEQQKVMKRLDNQQVKKANLVE